MFDLSVSTSFIYNSVKGCRSNVGVYISNVKSSYKWNNYLPFNYMY